MVETRELEISKRVFTLSDVDKLARCLGRAAERLPAGRADRDQDPPEFAFTGRCSDGSSYRSDSAQIFGPDSVLTRKKVEMVDLQMHDYLRHAHIDITLRHGRSTSDVEVRGTDTNWVNGTLTDIQETVGSFAPQDPFILRYPVVLKIALAIGIGHAFFWLFSPLISFMASDMQPPAFGDWMYRVSVFLRGNLPMAALISWVLMPFIAGLAWSLLFWQWLSSLWPSIELQIGPEHALVEKRRRNALLTTWTLAIVPLAVAVIYDVLKGSAK